MGRAPPGKSDIYELVVTNTVPLTEGCLKLSNVGVAFCLEKFRLCVQATQSLYALFVLLDATVCSAPQRFEEGVARRTVRDAR